MEFRPFQRPKVPFARRSVGKYRGTAFASSDPVAAGPHSVLPFYHAAGPVTVQGGSVSGRRGVQQNLKNLRRVSVALPASTLVVTTEPKAQSREIA